MSFKNWDFGYIADILFGMALGILLSGLVLLFIFGLSGCAAQGPPTFERVQNPPKGTLAGKPYYINDDLIRSFP